MNDSKCANCDTVGSESAFCPQCGQKRVKPGDLRLANAWRHLVDEVFNLDGRIFNTLQQLFLRPGLLTLDFLEGRRARHVHPLRLFLVFSAVYFLVEGTAIPAGIARSSLAITDGMPQLERESIEAAGVVAFKAAFIGAVLVHGLLLWLFFHKRRPLFAENMVTALHLSCAVMTITVVLGAAGRLLGFENAVPGITGAWMTVFGIHALKRVYHAPPQWLSGTCMMLMFVLDLVIITSVTIAAIHYRAGTLG